MNTPLSSQLDKSLVAPTAEGYGTITVRVVVLRKASDHDSRAEEAPPADAKADEVLPEAGKQPTSNYLEDPKRGRQCCVFLINGQRQHAWDNTFLVRDLDLKYLRNRTIVIVDVDGLKPEAIAELMQGSRHQFYEGTIYEAIAGRVIATLKDDPDLRRLEAAAEDEISSLKAGDEAVRHALDQLIQEHHDRAFGEAPGHTQPGDDSCETISGGNLSQTEDVVSLGDPSQGEAASEPVLLVRPEVATIRLKPGESRHISFIARPISDWAKLEKFNVVFDPPVRELDYTPTMETDRVDVDLVFSEPPDFDQDEYPVETLMRATAKFTGHEELRMCERRVVINPPQVRPPAPAPVLREEPTFVRVTSRQPVRMAPGGPDVHVRLRWDGKDQLVSGTAPTWTFHAACSSPASIPGMSLTSPVGGRFELLIQSPASLTLGDELTFTVEATGPGGKKLTTSFLLTPMSPPEPRRLQQSLQGGAHRRPPYELRYVYRADWDKDTCWGTTAWTKDDPGSFLDPTASQPLTLFVNQDTDLLTGYRDRLLEKRLTEATVQERTTRYTSHVAYHLYQMYLSRRTKNGEGAAQGPDDVPGDQDSAMREEIKRVATTLIMLMELSR